MPVLNDIWWAASCMIVAKLASLRMSLACRLTATTVALMLGAACGSAGPATDPPPDAAPSADAVAPPPPDDLQATTVGTLGSPQGMAGLALAALDEHHVLFARADAAGTAFCPDCAGPGAIPPDQCPDACKRTVVTLATARSGRPSRSGDRSRDLDRVDGALG